MSEVIRRPLMSGHCATMGMVSEAGRASHDRCHRQGGGQRANPQRQFQPCPCVCHYVDDEGELIVYECGECGRDVVAAPLWPFDEDGEVRYTHIDENDRAIGEECPGSTPVKPARKTERDCIRCGHEFTFVGREKICKACRDAEAAEALAAAEAEDDFSDLDDLDDDDFSDLDDLD